VFVVRTTKWGEKDFKFGNFIWLIEYKFLVCKFLDVMNLVICSCINRYMFIYIKCIEIKPKLV